LWSTTYRVSWFTWPNLSSIVSATTKNPAQKTYFGLTERVISPSDDFCRVFFAVGPSEHKHFIYVDKAFARLLHHYTIATTTTPIATTTTYYTYIQFAVSRAKRPELVYRFRDPKGTFKKTVSWRSIILHRVRTDANRPYDVNYVNKNENNKGLRAYSDRIIHYIYTYILYYMCLDHIVSSPSLTLSISMPIRLGHNVQYTRGVKFYRKIMHGDKNALNY